MASFKEAFAAARKAGKKEFTWKGKAYNTKYKEEVSAAPAKSKTPKAKPAPVKTEVSSGRGNTQAYATQGLTTRPRPKAKDDSVAPKTSSKPVANPKSAPGFVEKLRMGSAARTAANVSEAEMKRRKAFTASRAGKG